MSRLSARAGLAFKSDIPKRHTATLTCRVACALQSNAAMKQHSLEGDAPALMEHFIGLLRNFDAATLITLQGNAALHGRPMAIADVDTDGTLWFVTNGACPEI